VSSNVNLIPRYGSVHGIGDRGGMYYFFEKGYMPERPPKEPMVSEGRKREVSTPGDEQAIETTSPPVIRTLSDLKKSLMDSLQIRNFEETFAIVHKYLKTDSRAYNDWIFQQGRCNGIERQQQKGLIDNDFAQRTYNQIADALVYQIDKLKESDVDISQQSQPLKGEDSKIESGSFWDKIQQLDMESLKRQAATWKEKIAYFEEEEPLVTDLDQKFALKKKLHDAKKKYNALIKTISEKEDSEITSLNPSFLEELNNFFGEELNQLENYSGQSIPEVFVKLLDQSDDLDHFFALLDEEIEKYNSLLKRNLDKVSEKLDPLEKNYRALDLFFSNTDSKQLKESGGVNICNVSLDQLAEQDSSTINQISTILESRNLSLDLKDSFNQIVIPGYLGSKESIQRWGKLAHKDKAILITDAPDFEELEELLDYFENESISNSEVYHSHVFLLANWLKPNNSLKFVPPSLAAVGQFDSSLNEQKDRPIKGINESRFDSLVSSELDALKKLGLGYISKKSNRFILESDITLYNGDSIEYQNIFLVRKFNWINKSVRQMVNQRLGDSIKMSDINRLRNEISEFLKNCVKEEILSDYQIGKVARSVNMPNDIEVSLTIFPTESSKGLLIDFKILDSEEEKNEPEDSHQLESSDLLEQLKKLGELRDKGLLTEEEFLVQKRKLLE
jgi:hypothetical protein